ncbi:MAG TPA: VWA domain-containing protein, partial [Myxococcaceae bacterium]|nr:VWA domain-containing protein [Myxococcaceae bacterium]
MSRTLLLTCTAALLALVAVAVGLPPQTDTVHTVAEPGEAPGGVDLPLATARDGVLMLEGKLSGAYLKAGPSEAFAALAVRAQRPERVERRQPVSLALVIDRSGSMAGQKLADAKRAARMLVDRLEPEDQLALVHYGTDVDVLPSQPVTEAAREEMRAFIDAIEDDGGTNLSGGLEAGARQLRPHLGAYRVSRLLLLSDGQPTEGVVEEGELRKLARTYRAEGMAVSGLGVGEDFNEGLMQGLAEQGGGFYGYIQDSERLAEVLGRELEQAAGTVARGVALRLELPEGVTGAEVLGVRAEREGRTLKVPLYDLAGGQEARVVVKLTL